MQVQRGNTAKFTVEFYDWAEVLADPDPVTCCVLNYKMENILQLPVVRVGQGKFSAQWTPSSNGSFFLQWEGRLEGSPSLLRKPVEVVGV